MSDVDALTNEQISFVGETLGPLFLNDPKTDADVTEPLIRAFATLDANAAAAEWPFAGEAALRSLTDMRDGAASAIEGGADALIWEYRRLLVGPGRKPAPPWGSVYIDRECVVFGASTLALRAWMREHGIERLSDAADPEDHIGYVLLLMAWVAKHRPELLVEFLGEHVLTWSSHFLEQFEEAAEHAFYRGLASLTRSTLEGIGEELSIEVVYPRFYR